MVRLNDLACAIIDGKRVQKRMESAVIWSCLFVQVVPVPHSKGHQFTIGGRGQELKCILELKEGIELRPSLFGFPNYPTVDQNDGTVDLREGIELGGSRLD